MQKNVCWQAYCRKSFVGNHIHKMLQIGCASTISFDYANVRFVSVTTKLFLKGKGSKYFTKNHSNMKMFLMSVFGYFQVFYPSILSIGLFCFSVSLSLKI